MRGPFLPIYGSGAIMMLIVSMPFQDNLVMVYFAGCVGATVLEYVTGVTMEAFFKVRYWDYSDKKFQFQGHICLGSTLTWGLFTILMTEIVHKPVEQILLSIPEDLLTIITILLTIYICADFTLSFKAALDLRNILIRMEKIKVELLHIQNRLDGIIEMASEEIIQKKEAFTESFYQKKDALIGGISQRKESLVGGISQYKEELSEKLSGNWETRIEDLKKNIEERLEKMHKMILERPTDYSDNTKEEVENLRDGYYKKVDERNRLSRIKDFFQRDILRSHPTMRSKQFQEALEELKRRTEQKEEKDKEEK